MRRIGFAGRLASRRTRTRMSERHISMGKWIVCPLLLMGFACLAGQQVLPHSEEANVSHLHFDYLPSSTNVSTRIDVRFDVKPVVVPTGERLTVWIQLANRGELPVDVGALPVDSFMEKMNVATKAWAPMREDLPALSKRDGIYLSEGIKGFYPLSQVEAMKVTVLKEGRAWRSEGCVPPAYMLRSGMTVVFSQELTFLREGRWRLYYRVNGKIYGRDIISQERKGR